MLQRNDIKHVHQIVVDVSTEYHCGSKCMEAAMNGYAHNKVMYPISLHFEMILVSHRKI